LFGGEYHSVFKGRGMTFSEVREYEPGDDIRLIDWNVTARARAPFVKIFEEERELTVYFLVDISASGYFGSGKSLKQEIGAEIAAVLGFSAIKNNDKVGLILFSDQIEKYLPPKKGKSHVLRVIRELLFIKSRKKNTSIKGVIDYFMFVAKRRSVVFLISDYIDEGFWKSLKIANRKHDLIGIKLRDPSEISIPNFGLIKIQDPESGEVFWIDTSNLDDRKKIKNQNKNRIDEFDRQSKKIGFDIIHIKTNEDYVKPLRAFFKMREKRV
tara:strand:- start:55970 stop:56776 length:807 start_codon:yes stop_codon:yes gene_type:complete